MIGTRILLIDEDPNSRKHIKSFLEHYHYQLLEADKGLTGYALLDQHLIDLVLLELILPDLHGLELCRKIREKSDLPIIILSTVQDETSIVLGFAAGADDYLTKPFSLHILLARIQAMLKRALPTSLNYKRATFGQWLYTRQEGCLKHPSGKIVPLTRNECYILELFLTHQEKVLSREKIALALELDSNDPESRAIDVQISRLRHKLSDKSNQNLIKSIRNKGYLLSVPVKLA